MSKTYVPANLRQRVSARANRCCAYCLIHEDDSYYAVQVDPIISEKRGGRTEEANLALACVVCNRAKGSGGSTGSPSMEFATPRRDLRDTGLKNRQTSRTERQRRRLAARAWRPSASELLAQFRPDHGLNPDILARYKLNRLRVVPELVYGPHGYDGRLDPGLFVNGIPTATLELKSLRKPPNLPKRSMKKTGPHRPRYP